MGIVAALDMRWIGLYRSQCGYDGCSLAVVRYGSFVEGKVPFHCTVTPHDHLSRIHLPSTNHKHAVSDSHMHVTQFAYTKGKTARPIHATQRMY